VIAAGSSARTRLIGDDHRTCDPGATPPVAGVRDLVVLVGVDDERGSIAVEERRGARGEGDPVGPCLEAPVPGLVDDQVRQVTGVRSIRVLEAVLMRQRVVVAAGAGEGRIPDRARARWS